MRFMDPQTINFLASSTLFSIVEFFTIAFIILSTYLGMHNMFAHLKPATKMLVSMFLGTIAYSLGKLVLVTLIISPYVDQYYIKPF